MWDSNIYYSPGKFGLEIVGEIDRSDGCYQFDYVVVWRDPVSGLFYWAQDAGCSCPSPFEDFTKLEDLTVLNCIEDLDGIEENSYSEAERVTVELVDLKGRLHALGLRA